MKKCGFIAILGRPNAGKSTLTNFLVGSKVSIVSPKVQTTRQKITGIAMYGETQMVLLDTPGIFDPKKTLETAIVNNAYSVLDEADVFVVLVDVTDKNKNQCAAILERLPRNKKCILALNKIDKIPRESLLQMIDDFKAFETVDHIFMICALNGDGIDDMMKTIESHLPESEWLYPDDEITNMPTRIWAAELTREKLYTMLQHELPYETYVETESYETFENGSVKISQVIVIARNSQKPIIIGKGGSMLKRIGQTARIEMEKILGHRVHLKLFVKVRDDWMEKQSIRREIGLES